MNLDAYAKRIRYDGPLDSTLDTLRRLHRAHLLSVPFENLDIHLGRRISLDESALFDKIVTQNRGGFCYEQNGLFAAVLRALGFEVLLLEARVRGDDGTLGIPFDHLTLVVRCSDRPDRWLADVGFGDSFFEPLRLDDPDEQVQDRGVFRVTHDETTGLHTRREEEGWIDRYRFFLTPRTLNDFAEACHYHQTSPQTMFTKKRLCSMATPEGRITLSDLTLLITRGDQQTETILADEAAFQAALREHFGIALDEA